MKKIMLLSLMLIACNQDSYAAFDILTELLHEKQKELYKLSIDDLEKSSLEDISKRNSCLMNSGLMIAYPTIVGYMIHVTEQQLDNRCNFDLNYESDVETFCNYHCKEDYDSLMSGKTIFEGVCLGFAINCFWRLTAAIDYNYQYNVKQKVINMKKHELSKTKIRCDRKNK